MHSLVGLFAQVRVPVGNLLGEENKGFQCIVFNFNHERWGMAASIVAFSRLLLEECFRWAAVRKAFGKSLLEQVQRLPLHALPRRMAQPCSISCLSKQCHMCENHVSVKVSTFAI